MEIKKVMNVYEAPRGELLELGLPTSILAQVSVDGIIYDFEEGEDLE